MPKYSSNLSSYVKEFGEHVFRSDGKILFCKLCEVKVSASKQFLVTQHLKTAKHKHAVNNRKRREQSTVYPWYTKIHGKGRKSDSNIFPENASCNLSRYIA